MKPFLLPVFIFVFVSSLATAESLSPEDVVRTLVRGAHENNLQKVLDTADLVKIATRPRHGRFPENLVELLKGIEQDKIAFQFEL
jgi:hypothetical protein